MLNENVLMRELREKGYSYQINVFDNDFIQKMKESCGNKVLKQAAVGVNKKVNTEIRSDKICWLEKEDASQTIKDYFSFIEKLKSNLNKNFFLGLKDFEVHFAQYDTGSFYKKHKDNVNGTSKRIVTVILYLNENWQPEHGGQLRLHGNEVIDINPVSGSMIVFMSEEILHEVLPCNTSRSALTGWLLNE